MRYIVNIIILLINFLYNIYYMENENDIYYKKYMKYKLKYLNLLNDNNYELSEGGKGPFSPGILKTFGTKGLGYLKNVAGRVATKTSSVVKKVSKRMSDQLKSEVNKGKEKLKEELKSEVNKVKEEGKEEFNKVTEELEDTVNNLDKQLDENSSTLSDKSSNSKKKSKNTSPKLSDTSSDNNKGTSKIKKIIKLIKRIDDNNKTLFLNSLLEIDFIKEFIESKVKEKGEKVEEEKGEE